MDADSAEERAYVEAIRESPDDDGPRLIFADWLDDRGDPRGRFVRVQLALAKLSEYDPRRPDLEDEERALRLRHEPGWSADVGEFATGLVYRRGLLHEINMTARQFLAHASRVFDAAPIRSLHLLDAGRNLEAVLNSPLLARLDELTLYAQYLGGSGGLADRLARSPSLATLKSLRIGRNRLTDDDVVRLGKSPLSASLESLDLHDNPVSDAGVENLADWPKLAKLNLSRTAVSPGMASSLAASPSRPVLQSLSLAGIPSVGTISSESLALFRVANLNLEETGLTVLGLNRLLAAGDSPRCRTLHLAGNSLGDGGAAALAASPALTDLRFLDLRRNDIRDGGIDAIVKSTVLEKLQHLNVTSNPIEPIGWALFLDANGLPGLRRLDLPTAGISPVLHAALDRKYNRPRG